MTNPGQRPVDLDGSEAGEARFTGPSTAGSSVLAHARSRQQRGRLGSALGLILLVLFSMVSVAQTVRQHPQLSQIDEASHIDAVLAAPGVVRTGQQLSAESLDIVSCRLVENLDYPWPTCGSGQATPPADYPLGAGGFTTSDIHPPVYYWLTALAVGVGDLITDLDQVVLMRLTGAVWLALGACLSWLLARRLGAGRLASLGAAGLLAASFSAQQMSAIVNPAAMMLPVGAAYALLALWARNRTAAWWALPVGAVAAMAVTAANLAGLAVVWLSLLVDPAWRAWRAGRAAEVRDDVLPSGPDHHASALDRTRLGDLPRMAGIVGVSALAAFFAAVGWWWLQRSRALISFDQLPAAAIQKPADLDWTQALAPVLNFVAPLEFAPAGARLGTSGPPIVQAMALCLLAGLAARAWVGGDRAFPALIASLVGLLTLPVAYVLLWYWAEGRYFTPWFRFGLSMMPFVAAAVAGSLRRRWSGGLLAVTAGAGMLLAVATT